MNRKIISLLMIIIVIFSFTISASADTYTAPNGYSYDYLVYTYNDLLCDSAKNPHVYENVWDFADLLTDEEEKMLQEKVNEDLELRGVKVYFMTYDNTCGEDNKTFCDDFFDYYVNGPENLGTPEEINAMFYTINIDDRTLWTFTRGPKYAPKLSDSKAYDLQDKSQPYAHNGDYYQYFVSNDNVMLEYLFPTSDEKSTPTNKSIKLMPTGKSIIFSAIGAIATIIYCVYKHKSFNVTPPTRMYIKNFNILGKDIDVKQIEYYTETIDNAYSGTSSGGSGDGGTGGGGDSGGGGGNSF